MKGICEGDTTEWQKLKKEISGGLFSQVNTLTTVSSKHSPKHFWSNIFKMLIIACTFFQHTWACRQTRVNLQLIFFVPHQDNMAFTYYH